MIFIYEKKNPKSSKLIIQLGSLTLITLAGPLVVAVRIKHVGFAIYKEKYTYKNILYNF